MAQDHQRELTNIHRSHGQEILMATNTTLILTYGPHQHRMQTGEICPDGQAKKVQTTAAASEGTLMCLSFQGERRTVQVAGGRHAPPVIIVVQRTEIIEIGLGERTTLLLPGGKFQQHLPVVVTCEIHKQATSVIVPEITNSSAKRGNVKHKQLQKTNQHT